MAKKILKSLCIAAFWLAIWEILSLIVGKEVLLPSPAVTVKTLFSLAVTGEFWAFCGASVMRIAAGLIFGTAAGVILAALSARSILIRDAVSPVLSIIRATPVASFIILALVWIGRGNVPAFTAFLMVLPVIRNSVLVGISGIDRSLKEVSDVYGFSFIKRFRLLYFPSVAPSFFGGLRTCLGLAWKAGIAAEVICNPERGIGAALYDSKVYLNTAELFAWTAAVVIISMIFEKVLDRISLRLTGKGGALA